MLLPWEDVGLIARSVGLWFMQGNWSPVGRRYSSRMDELNGVKETLLTDGGHGISVEAVLF